MTICALHSSSSSRQPSDSACVHSAHSSLPAATARAKAAASNAKPIELGMTNPPRCVTTPGSAGSGKASSVWRLAVPRPSPFSRSVSAVGQCAGGCSVIVPRVPTKQTSSALSARRLQLSTARPPAPPPAWPSPGKTLAAPAACSPVGAGGKRSVAAEASSAEPPSGGAPSIRPLAARRALAQVPKPSSAAWIRYGPSSVTAPPPRAFWKTVSVG
mmetsp:Transcript_36298/g.120169  ORF Transcript_36298/g.120169 Transcript_36298/m.120169 type:complete len:215 (+) Transcript_36298:383-1027(+)